MRRSFREWGFAPNFFLRRDQLRYPPYFSATASGANTAGARNNLIGPKEVNFDFSAIKDFHVTEKHALQLRVEMFNAVNHVELGNPATGWGKLERAAASDLWYDYLNPRKHAPDSVRPQVQLLTPGTERN